MHFRIWKVTLLAIFLEECTFPYLRKWWTFSVYEAQFSEFKFSWDLYGLPREILWNSNIFAPPSKKVTNIITLLYFGISSLSLSFSHRDVCPSISLGAVDSAMIDVTEALEMTGFFLTLMYTSFSYATYYLLNLYPFDGFFLVELLPFIDCMMGVSIEMGQQFFVYVS